MSFHIYEANFERRRQMRSTQGLRLLVHNCGQACSAADLDGDGDVDAADLVILQDNWSE